MASPRRKDPTSTLTLRLWSVRQINRRFGAIKRAVTQTLVDNAALTVDGKGKISANAQAATRERFIYLRDAAKVDEFGKWVREQVNTDVFDGNVAASSAPSTFWQRTVARTAYGRGATKAQQHVLRFYADTPTAAILGRTIYGSAAHVERAELIYTRIFEQLRGVTAQMEAQMRGVLSDGIIKGLSTRQIARNLNDRIDKIGIARAKLISRTEIVNAHNYASISAAKDLERSIEGAEVKLKWVTALDGRERPSHRARNGKIYTQAEASRLIGEPNCRCSVSAHLPEFED